MENTSTIEEVEKVINKLRPYLNRDGGDIELLDFKDGIGGLGQGRSAPHPVAAVGVDRPAQAVAYHRQGRGVRVAGQPPGEVLYVDAAHPRPHPGRRGDSRHLPPEWPPHPAGVGGYRGSQPPSAQRERVQSRP